MAGLAGSAREDGLAGPELSPVVGHGAQGVTAARCVVVGTVGHTARALCVQVVVVVHNLVVCW